MHNGSVAAQGYLEYYTHIRGSAEESWAVAKVGSIQFNGNVIEGNAYWVNKTGGDGTDPKHREYHMARVMCHFTTCLGLEDYKQARKEARNFQDYFRAGREMLLKEIKSLPKLQSPVSPP